MLGPLLYILFTKDIFCLADYCNNRIISFADDTSVSYWATNYEELFQKANVLMENVNKWLCFNKLSLNINKTMFICYGFHKYCLDDTKK